MPPPVRRAPVYAALDLGTNNCRLLIAIPTRPEYNKWHEKLNKLGGYDVYKEMLPVVREYPKDKRAIDVEPRRWWKSA